MSLLALLARASATPTEPPAGGNTEPGVPYALPLAPPYNVDQVCVIPTPDGSGQTVHPDVVDFAQTSAPGGKWKGHLYWMGITPFAGGDPRLENPCIYVSDNGYTWEVPAGLTNPLEFGPGPVYHANSDTDLTYDPVDDRLILIWRLYNTGSRVETIKMKTSTDGVTWSATQDILVSDGGPTDNNLGVQQVTSPSIVRVGPTDWRMWASGASGAPDTMRTATSPAGPWSAPQVCTFAGSGLDPYHADVIEGPDGRLWMLGQTGGKLFPAVSTDGVSWTSGHALFTSPRPGRWDQQPYRATMTPHENGTHMRVWYSSLYDDGVTPPGYYSSQDWWTGYTWVKRDHWLSL